MTILNTHYKIPEITLNNLFLAIARFGFNEAFDIALERAVNEMRDNPSSILIAECLSWSYDLNSRSLQLEDQGIVQQYAEASLFCRKLAHHAYWVARKDNIVEYNPVFIQAVR